MEKHNKVKFLAKYREVHKLSSTDMAKLIGIGQPSYIRYENGMQPLSIQFLQKLAIGLKSKINVIITADGVNITLSYHYNVPPLNIIHT